MAHGITSTDKMAFTGDRNAIWHGLGNNLAVGAPIEEWQRAAGMEWEIKRSRVRFGCGENQQTIDDSHVLFRSDNKAPLGIVSDKYQVVNPAETLEFFRDIVGAGGFELSTAGTLFGGRRFWALARIGEDAVVIGQDKITGYLLLASSADGSLATLGKFVAERVVCNNTLTIARAEKGSQVKISHRSSFDPAAMKKSLGIATDSFAKFMRETRRMAEHAMTDVAAQEFVKEVMLEQKLTTREPEKTPMFNSAMDLFRGLGKGAALDGTAGTLWGVVNSITEYVDHHARAKTDSHRLDTAWFGKGDDTKSATYDKALAIVA